MKVRQSHEVTKSQITIKTKNSTSRKQLIHLFSISNFVVESLYQFRSRTRAKMCQKTPFTPAKSKHFLLTYNCSPDLWLIEQGLTSHQTHYMVISGTIFTGHMTKPTLSKHWRPLSLDRGTGLRPFAAFGCSTRLFTFQKVYTHPLLIATILMNKDGHVFTAERQGMIKLADL